MKIMGLFWFVVPKTYSESIAMNLRQDMALVSRIEKLPISWQQAKDRKEKGLHLLQGHVCARDLRTSH